MSIIFSKTSGTGNSGKIDITSEVYKGRNDRYKTFQVQSASGNASATIKVTQVGFGLANELSINSYQISNDGGQITLKGYSNAYALRLQIPTSLDLILTVDNLTINGILQDLDSDNHAVIANDPGNDNTYEYIYTLNCPANNNIVSRSVDINVIALDETEDSTKIASLTVIQSAGSAYIYVNTNGVDESESCNIAIASEETSASVYVLSNVEWSIEKV